MRNRMEKEERENQLSAEIDSEASNIDDDEIKKHHNDIQFDQK